jgi:hypothetical protein
VGYLLHVVVTDRYAPKAAVRPNETPPSARSPFRGLLGVSPAFRPETTNGQHSFIAVGGAAAAPLMTCSLLFAQPHSGRMSLMGARVTRRTFPIF